jgi:predicted secreted protein
MAAVQSAPGTPNVVRRVNDTTIASAVINKAAAFYYVQVDIPTVNLNLLGVQVEVKPTCP